MQGPDLNRISEVVIGCAIEVHRHLGPGLLESSYEECLCYELAHQALRFQRQTGLPISYKGIKIDCAYRIDILVEQSLVLELKSVEKIEPLHEAQLLTYLRLSRCTLGLLINFNVPVLKNGIVRRVLGFTDQ